MSEKEMRELDVWIAKRVMNFNVVRHSPSLSAADGHTYFYQSSIYHWQDDYGPKKELFRPTENPAAAMQVLEKCYHKTGGLSICTCASPEGFKFWLPNRFNKSLEAETLPLAICLFGKALFSQNESK